jgi:hypothetical protein
MDPLLAREHRPSRLHTLLVLALLAHAIAVGALHHHGLPIEPDLAAVSSGHSTDSSGDPQSSHDSSCASCRLQRTFESADRAQAPLGELLEPVRPRQATPTCLFVSEFAATSSTRGPPLS